LEKIPESTSHLREEFDSATDGESSCLRLSSVANVSNSLLFSIASQVFTSILN
jgi:hypothetical protein